MVSSNNSVSSASSTFNVNASLMGNSNTMSTFPGNSMYSGQQMQQQVMQHSQSLATSNTSTNSVTANASTDIIPAVSQSIPPHGINPEFASNNQFTSLNHNSGQIFLSQQISGDTGNSMMNMSDGSMPMHHPQNSAAFHAAQMARQQQLNALKMSGYMPRVNHFGGPPGGMPPMM